MIPILLVSTVPILLAALGGLVTEKAGVLNIGLEGMMLFGAFCGYLAGMWTGQLWVGVFAGMAGGILLGGVMTIFSVYLGANIFISGLGINLLATGLTQTLGKIVSGTEGVIKDPSFPRFPDVFGTDIFTLICLTSPLWIWYLLTRTPAGLRIRGAGENPEGLYIRGISAQRSRSVSLLLSAALAGMGGAALSINLGAYVPGISAGRGWIALVAVYLGARNPFGVLAASLVFSAAFMLADRLQGVDQLAGDPLVSGMVLALPFIVTLLGMIIQGASRTLKGE